MNALDFGTELKKLGYNFYSGVPCSFLTPLINYCLNECDYVMASNESDAVAISSGAYLSGKKSVVLMQNSGLSNASSALTSLNYSFKIPVLGFVSLRGEQSLNDEPQHELMGHITDKMLEIMDIKYSFLSTDIEEAKRQLLEADKYITENKTFFFIVKKDTFEKLKLNDIKTNNRKNEIKIKKTKEDTKPTRFDALKTISDVAGKDIITFATTGFTGRELYEVEDKSNNLYMVGSMGCISSFALGFALNKKDRDIIAIDGDGALIMRMGNLATNGYYSPKNMAHILLDNNCHDSTGGQFTVSNNVDFIEVASSCNYEKVYYAHNVEELQQYLLEWRKNKGLTFIYLKTTKGAKDNLSRPKIKPYQVKERLMEILK